MMYQSGGTTSFTGSIGPRLLIIGSLVAVGALSAGRTLGQTVPSPSDAFQARIVEVARSLQTNPQLKKLSQLQRENLVTFITGNMLFVMLHEMAHATVSELNVPVIGREEDGADDFAIVRMLQVGSGLSHRILVEAAKGWFFSDRRDRHDKEPLYFYDEHGLDKQRAYQIVCVMVGSDPAQFKDLADETKLPDDRQKTCKRDYDRAVSGWTAVLKPHLRSPDQPKTKVDVVYGDGKGKYDAYAQGFQSLRLLETVAERASEELVWPVPFALETQTCGFINGAWNIKTHKLVLCYELAEDFAELYRDYNNDSGSVQKKRKSR